MEEFLKYAPIIIAVVVYIYQNNLFVRPETLEQKHTQIIKEVEEKFLTLAAFKEFKENVSDIKEKIDKIYDCIIAGQNCSK